MTTSGRATKFSVAITESNHSLVWLVVEDIQIFFLQIFSLGTHCEHSGVVFTLVSVVVAVTFLALIFHLASGRPPGHVLVEILALLTVIPPEVIIYVTERQVIGVEVPT